MKQVIAHDLMSKIKMPSPRIKPRNLEFHLATEKGVSVLLTLLGQGRGAESARTFFKRLFLYEKRGLEVPNFVTFPNSL